MGTVRLGRSGLRVSEIALGAWTFGRETAAADAFTMMDRFVELGGNLIDTADAYHQGGSEAIAGAWIADRNCREQVLLATKAHFPMGLLPNDMGLSRKHLVRALDASLHRLRTDYVDLYQTHCWDPGVAVEETLSTLNDFVRAGKVRYVGASNYSGWQLVQSVLLSRGRGWVEFVSVQNEYSLLSRGNELEVVPACADEGIGLLAWSPLGGGWLTGKYRRGVTGPLPHTRVAESAIAWQPDSWEQRGNESTWAVVDALLEVASGRGVPAAQVALNWARAKPHVVAPIVGARTLEQLETNLGCLDWELSAEEVVALDAASAPPAPYPYSFIAHVERMYERSTDRWPGRRDYRLP